LTGQSSALSPLRARNVSKAPPAAPKLKTLFLPTLPSSSIDPKEIQYDR
jgi:hypothetical protein